MSALPFVVFGQGRTGSTHLCSLLDSHPDVGCEREILKDKVDNVFRFLLEKERASPFHLAWGFKVKPYQLTWTHNMAPRYFLETVHSFGWRIIHLHRRDRFRHALSKIVLDIRAGMGLGSQAKEEGQFIPPIYVDPVELFRRMYEREAILSQELQDLADIPHLSIAHEDMVENPQREALIAFEYLGLPAHHATSPYKKVTPKNWEEQVLNSFEIKEALRPLTEESP